MRTGRLLVPRSWTGGWTWSSPRLQKAECEVDEAKVRTADLEQRRAALVGALAQAEREGAQAQARVSELEQSRSWRVTARFATWAAEPAWRARAPAPRSRACASCRGGRRWRLPSCATRAPVRWRRGSRRSSAAAPASVRRPPTEYSLATAIHPLAFPQVGAPRVSIVIPVYGKPQLTFTCLASVLAETPAHDFEVIVVDDASPEPAAQALPS